MQLKEQFLLFIKEHALFAAEDRLLIAVSGGVDSVVLCHLCREAGYDVAMAHCNFQLRGTDSDRDEQFVRQLADSYGVPFFSRTFDTYRLAKEQKKSVEETARDARYAWFSELVQTVWTMRNGSPGFLLTAHHADDNIETVLMNLFRGTGIRGLRGILPKQHAVIRPLLFARKKELVEYATEHHLSFVTDYTNTQDEFTRNFFRNRVIPLVKEYFPAAEENLLHSISRFGETEFYFRQAIDLHKKKLLEQKGAEIHIPVLKLKKSGPLTTLVYEIIRDFGFSSGQVKEVIELLESGSGKFISSASHRIIKNRNWLIIAPAGTGESEIIIIEGEGEWIYPGGVMEVRPGAKAILPVTPQMACLDAKEISFPLILRRWKPGDYFYPLGMKKKKKLSRFLIDLKLSKTEKEKIWVLEMNKKIIWVAGYRIDDRFKQSENTASVLCFSLK